MTRMTKIYGDTEVVAGSMKSLGLCMTCNHVGICTNRRTFVGPVTFCEEFDDFVEPQEVAATGEETYTIISTPGPAAQLGLCVNCAHQAGCALRGVEGGVWHCEEYA